MSKPRNRIRDFDLTPFRYQLECVASERGADLALRGMDDQSESAYRQFLATEEKRLREAIDFLDPNVPLELPRPIPGGFFGPRYW